MTQGKTLDKERGAVFQSTRKCERVLQVFSLFSNEKRFKILCCLREGDFCVSEIVDRVGGTVSNISQQLKLLTLSGYLSRKRVERSVYYHLKDQRIRALLEYLYKQYGGDE